MNFRLLLLFLLFLVTSCTSNYYLVRHAERLDDTSHSPLSDAGFERATALRDTLFAKGIDSIFASTYLRTQQTAQSLADALAEPLTIYSPDTTSQFTQMLHRIKGKDVLVVGHSNTVPEIVEGMTGQTVSIEHDDYDNLFLVKIKRSIFGTRIRLFQLTYGERTP